MASGEYRNISFIHEIAENSVEDVTEAILAEATLPHVPPGDVDLHASRLDHARDLRKHERT
ncbi:putative DNA-binding protein [Bradyrhizobium diazoefficiens]